MSGDSKRRVWAGMRGQLRAIYEREGGAAGCCLHLAADDGNVDDGSIAWCLYAAARAGHPLCSHVARFLACLTRAQRRTFLRPRRRQPGTPGQV